MLVSSLVASRGLPRSATVYSATKAALVSIGQSLRTEFGGTGIVVTTLRPGYIRTEINESSRFPFMTSVERGVASMVKAIDQEVADVIVPVWPWRPLSWLLRYVPSALIRRVL